MAAVLKTLLLMSAAASVMIAVVLGIRAALSRRMNPAVMLALWALVLLRLCLPFTLPSPVHVFSLPPEQSAAAQSAGAPQAAASAAPMLPAMQAHGSSAAMFARPWHWPDTERQPAATAGEPAYGAKLAGFLKGVSVWDALAAAWALGALAVLLSALWRALRFGRKLRICKPVADGAVLRAIERHRRGMRVRKRIRALECGFVEAPLVFGYFKPVILIPAQFISRMGASRMNGILLHEICHIKRHDMLVNYLWLAAKAAHWFNPLVWAAYRCFQGDVELCRDHMTVNLLKGDARLEYGQSLIDSARYTRRARDPLPNAAASLIGRRSGVKERVLRMVAPRKRSGLSLAASSLLALVMLASCFTTACQPTPTKPVVVNKGDGGLEQKLTQTATPLPSGGAETSAARSLRQRFGIPERLQAELANEGDTVRVHIDAAIDVPDVSAMPVYSAEFASFTQEQVGRMHQVLLGGGQVYEPGGPTRKHWQELIVIAQQEIADAKKRGDKEWQEKSEKDLAHFQEQFINTPDNIELKPAKLEFQKGDADSDVINVMADVNGRMMVLQVSNTGTRASASLGITNDIGFPTHYLDHPGLTSPAGVSLSREEAGRQASEIAARLDENMKLAAVMVGYEPVPDGPQVWMVAFTRTIDGVPTPFDRRDVGEDETNDAPPMPYEKLWIMLDDKGFAGMEWKAPMKITGPVNSDAALLSYAEIEAKAKSMLLSNSQGAFEGMKKVSKYLDVKVDRVTLGFTRIAVPDKPGQFLLVPVWDFFGVQIPDTSGYPDKKKEGLDYEHMMSGSLLTINAIDGSVIDRRLGY